MHHSLKLRRAEIVCSVVAHVSCTLLFLGLKYTLLGLKKRYEMDSSQHVSLFLVPRRRPAALSQIIYSLGGCGLSRSPFRFVHSLVVLDFQSKEIIYFFVETHTTLS